MPQLFAQFAQTYSPQIESVVKTFLALKKKDAVELSPHLLHSTEVIEEFLLRGGKGIRSLLVLLGYLLAGGSVDEGENIPSGVIRVAAGIEVFHKHILNLDDMADRDEQRYGGPTLWQLYQDEFVGNKQQKNAAEHFGRTMSEIDGTLIGSFAFDLVRTAKLPAENILDVIGVMNQIMYWRTVAGWQIHFFQNQQKLADANEAEFLKGLELVTAEYTFVAPLTIGLILAGKQHLDFAQQLLTAGRFVGTAFQLRDDELGLFGDPVKTGKPVGNDVREGKKTLLLQRAYQRATKENKEFLNDVCGRDLTRIELQRVQEIVMDTGAFASSQELERQKIATAITELNNISFAKNDNVLKAKNMFIELAHYVISREK